MNYEQNIPLIFKYSPMPCAWRGYLFIHGIFDFRKDNEQHREQLSAGSTRCGFRRDNKAYVVLYQL